MQLAQVMSNDVHNSVTRQYFHDFEQFCLTKWPHAYAFP